MGLLRMLGHHLVVVSMWPEVLLLVWAGYAEHSSLAQTMGG